MSAGKAAGLLLALGLAAGALAQTQQASPPAQPSPPAPQEPQKRTGHPYPQPLLGCSTQTTSGDTTTVATGESLFPPSRPFIDPPGTNLLPTIYTNLFDGNGDEVPNTLPSTPSNPYNLHAADPVVSQINPTSPADDLQTIFSSVPRLLGRDDRHERSERNERDRFDEASVRKLLQLGIDILEGNPVPNRAYSGFALLHYTGPEELKVVEPIHDASGKVVGGNVDVHQAWYGGRIEADTDMVDPTAVLEVPWTITYTVDVLSRGEDDFSPFAIFVDVPPATPPPPCPPVPPACNPPLPPAKPPLAAMDQTFFPMADGTRTVFKIKMPPGKYLNMVYVWGWRMHPPRIQVIENATKKVNCTPLHQLEVDVFGPAPRSSEQAKLAAIAKIGDLSPAKRMWQAFREARGAAEHGDWKRVESLVGGAREAFEDWQDRTQLPRGVKPDPEADITLLYVNNTIYGELTAGTLTRWPAWQTRGAELKVTLYNGDFFDHGYMNVDFGGGRGWENQFKSSVKWGGSGCWFTFGRAYWWPNLAAMVIVPAATQNPYRPGLHKVRITYNFDPSRRLRFYQFDPMHHDVAIFSVH